MYLRLCSSLQPLSRHFGAHTRRPPKRSQKSVPRRLLGFQSRQLVKPITCPTAHPAWSRAMIACMMRWMDPGISAALWQRAKKNTCSPTCIW
jgi:hypothetical protein